MNRDEMKQKAKDALKYAEDKAEEGLVRVETKFPVGTAIVCAVLGLIVGLYLRGLFR
jgi:hypothetical protein